MAATVELDMEGAQRPSIPEPEKSGKLRWVIQPVLAVGLIIGVLIYTEVGDLSKNEQASLEVDALLDQTGEHLKVSLVATFLVCIIAIPFGIALTRGGMRRYSDPILAVAGFGQAAPVIGLIVISIMIFGFDQSFLAAVAALTVYGILPIVANTVAGLNGVDPKLVEASRGMGMSSMATLLRVEIPIALPVIVAGMRTALVLMVGAAAMVVLIGAGGLGTPIDTGIKRMQTPVLICGALLVAALALFVDWLAHLIEMIASPKGL
ncbi:ABC transporter permease [Solicola gregarius]|uniref:ABC transporter permease n=1 Tax=Solicola gregarius TaxID=2908642 RepID=A0AA46YKT9_9ACTN|nr:ABC transporter permease [Solicola gregarius]UYM04841.1 ABC transporter permease [Solicola gregarius]